MTEYYPKSLQVIVVGGAGEQVVAQYDGDFDAIMEEVEEYLDAMAACRDEPDEVHEYPDAVLVRDADTGEVWVRWLPAEMAAWQDGCIRRDTGGTNDA